MIIFFMYDVFLAIAKMINPAAFEEKKEGDAKKEEKKDEAKKDKWMLRIGLTLPQKHYFWIH